MSKRDKREDFDDYLRTAERELESAHEGDSDGLVRDYSPDELFPPMIVQSDNHGHSDTLSTRVHPRLGALIDRIVERKTFPIKSRSHFMACAMLHFIETLKSLDPSVNSILGQIGGIASLTETNELARQYDMQLDKIVEQIAYMKGKGMHEAAGKLASKFMAEIRAMPAGDWKRVWESEALPKLEKLVG